MQAPIITFLSDYGLQDDFVGVCHGVIAAICPQARVIDLTHGVRRHDVRQGALILAQALFYLPVGVHLAVVDPGVGGDRRAVAVTLADGRRLVGPDNGLLSLAAARGEGIVEAVDIAASPFCLRPISATFHGRDVFAPVAAALAAGEPLSAIGEPIDATGVVTLELPEPRTLAGALVAHVRDIDRFGNVQLDGLSEHLAALGIEPGGAGELALGDGSHHRFRYGRTFTDAADGELLLYEDSARQLAVAVNQASAASRLGLAVDDELRIST
jgi:S-adenosyl-L-methionine hydrolase (adenosine-forming)